MSTDPDARFTQLVEQYGKLISAVVRRVASRVGAEARRDIEQRVLLSLWKRLQNEQVIQFPTSYLYKMAVREGVRAVREEVRWERKAECAVDTGVVLEGPHENLVAKERLAILEEAMKRLSDDRREAVQGHLAGFSVGEIMSLHGWPYQKARNLIARGMVDLRRLLIERGLDV